MFNFVCHNLSINIEPVDNIIVLKMIIVEELLIQKSMFSGPRISLLVATITFMLGKHTCMATVIKHGPF